MIVVGCHKKKKKKLQYSERPSYRKYLGKIAINMFDDIFNNK